MGGSTTHILLIDDEPDLCWALERMLQTSEIHVSSASCGADALAMLRQQCYAVAFLDAVLPDANGIELAEQILAISPCTVLVLMSGYYYLGDQSLAHAPIIGFLAKPFSRSDVLAMLQQALSANRCQQEGRLCNTSCSLMMKTTCSG
ncbi:response regulator [Chloroflexales bacterium ZM16-3]|nr:response regulator [Chloroflexales bacterium ZM16-3]